MGSFNYIYYDQRNLTISDISLQRNILEKKQQKQM